MTNNVDFGIFSLQLPDMNRQKLYYDITSFFDKF